MPLDYSHVFYISNYGIMSANHGGLIGGPTRRVMLAKRNGIVITYDKGKDNDATLKVKLKQAYAKKNQKGVPMNKIMKNFNSDLKELKTRGSVLVVL